jgi:hypothetical protein
VLVSRGLVSPSSGRSDDGKLNKPLHLARQDKLGTPIEWVGDGVKLALLNQLPDAPTIGAESFGSRLYSEVFPRLRHRDISFSHP